MREGNENEGRKMNIHLKIKAEILKCLPNISKKEEKCIM